MVTDPHDVLAHDYNERIQYKRVTQWNLSHRRCTVLTVVTTTNNRWKHHKLPYLYRVAQVYISIS